MLWVSLVEFDLHHLWYLCLKRNCSILKQGDMCLALQQNIKRTYTMRPDHAEKSDVKCQELMTLLDPF